MRKFAIALLGLAFIVAPALAGQGKFNKVLAPGDKAPAIADVKACMGSEECTVNLEDCKEDVVVVTFLANHCPAVVAYEDRLVELANSYKGKSVKFIGICCSDPESPVGATDNLDAIKVRVKEKGYGFVYGYDPTGKIGKAYGAVVTPQTFVLDKNRVIRYTGAIDDNQNEARAKAPYLKNAIDATLSGETVEVTETQAKGCGIKYAAR
jgi:thiol-disulfide isomerase/thioredoxin